MYGALWATSKENNVINLVNGTVSQNTLTCVLRISYVVEPIFRRYHQPMSLLMPDYVRSSYKSLNCFPCRSDFSWGKNIKTKGARSSEYGACCILICTRVIPLYMNLNVSTGIIFADTQNSMALRMSFNGVTSLIFPNSYHDDSAISDISNTNQPTKEHQTSKKR